MRNKVTYLLAATLTLLCVAIFGFQEIGGKTLAKAALYAVALSVPLIALTSKYKNQLLRIKSAGPIGIVVGGVLFRILSGYSKLSLFTFMLLVGILFVFLSLIYTDKELEQKTE